MTTTKRHPDDILADEMAACERDPLRYVLSAFDWGVGPLKDETGPRVWQREVLTEIGFRLRGGQTPEEAVAAALATQPVLLATASGHGIGKSALVAWIILWAMSTRVNTRGVVTANTDTQLRTKTWPEVKKWHGLSINAHWFTCAATSIHAKDPRAEKTWRVDAIPWSEHNTEAFAGLHNKGGRILLVFDEASGIPDKIWEVASGALSDADTEIVWAVFGNPSRNTGSFHACFGSRRHRWSCRQIDSRTVEGTNKVQLAKEVADYGEDSDRVRVRIRGVFPRSGSKQLIPSNLVAGAAALTRPAMFNPSDPVIVGVDVARFGQDESVIAVRKGRDARTYPWRAYHSMDTMQLAARVVEVVEDLARKQTPVDAIFVDESGIGGAVIDRLRQLGYRPIGVNNGAAADKDPDGIMVRRKDGEQWVRMRAWLGTDTDGGAIPHDDLVLHSQLEGREYDYDKDSKIVLESKQDMSDRGLSSPDRADALALTFAYHVGSANQRAYEDLHPLNIARERRAYDPLARVRRR